MARLVRFFVAAFLAVAVPLQGLAGVTMAACGPTHGGQAMHHAAKGDDSVAMNHDHAAMEHEGHDAGAGISSGGGEGDHSGHRCTACAACCSLSAAPVPAFVFHGASPAPSVAIPFLEIDRASFQPAALERPPSPSYLG